MEQVSKDDGGAAFPTEHKEWEYDGDKWGWQTKFMESGMSLRDYFAAKAMQGFAANGAFARDDGLTTDDLVGDAYDIADAMLKARQS